jgi:hypothetical protein
MRTSCDARSPAPLRSHLHRRDCCLGPDEGDPVPHCWQRWTSPFGVPGIGAGSEPKKPFRRCFKPRRPLRAGYAGFASGCRSREQGSKRLFLRRLSGLLSGCPPTDTRPQARAKLGDSAIRHSAATCKRFGLNEKLAAEFSAAPAHGNAPGFQSVAVNGSTRPAARTN